MRRIDHIVVHCSASQPSSKIGAAEIRKLHTDPKPNGRGWSDIGYHFVIRTTGEIETGRALETPGAHVEGHNANSIGICMVGGINAKGKSEANFTELQYNALKVLVRKLKVQFPKAEVLGHRDFPGVKKDCPCFDVREFFNGK